MGKGRNKILDIYCSNCHTQLYRYVKDSSEGRLIKFYPDRILEDYTKTPMTCPECSTEFARPYSMHCKPVYKVIQGKVYSK